VLQYRQHIFKLNYKRKVLPGAATPFHPVSVSMLSVSMFIVCFGQTHIWLIELWIGQIIFLEALRFSRRADGNNV
jgi:hypothetical protein